MSDECVAVIFVSCPPGWRGERSGDLRSRKARRSSETLSSSRLVSSRLASRSDGSDRADMKALGPLEGADMAALSHSSHAGARGTNQGNLPGEPATKACQLQWAMAKWKNCDQLRVTWRRHSVEGAAARWTLEYCAVTAGHSRVIVALMRTNRHLA